MKYPLAKGEDEFLPRGRERGGRQGALFPHAGCSPDLEGARFGGEPWRKERL
jgi:hypothetical protein